MILPLKILILKFIRNWNDGGISYCLNVADMLAKRGLCRDWVSPGLDCLTYDWRQPYNGEMNLYFQICVWQWSKWRNNLKSISVSQDWGRTLWYLPKPVASVYHRDVRDVWRRHVLLPNVSGSVYWVIKPNQWKRLPEAPVLAEEKKAGASLMLGYHYGENIYGGI